MSEVRLEVQVTTTRQSPFSLYESRVRTRSEHLVCVRVEKMTGARLGVRDATTRHLDFV